MKKISLIAVFSILIDQIIKIIVSNSLTLNKSIILIKDFFSLTYVRNDGAAFSILSGNRFFLIMIAFLTLFLIYFFFIENKNLSKIEIITYSLLIGGIIGNLIDRIIFGYVIDYLDFYIFNYNFPVFNFADICIVISVLFLILDILKGEYR